MSNNLKNIVLGLLALVVVGFFFYTFYTKEEISRYTPINNNGKSLTVLDTKTGRVYQFSENGYFFIDLKQAKPVIK